MSEATEQDWKSFRSSLFVKIVGVLAELYWGVNS